MFYDILVYSSSLEDHLSPLKQVLENIMKNQLYAKMLKCRFGVHEVEYLGHVVSREEVKTDPNRVASMIDWPVPTTLKALRGFLGLTGYYKKFIRNYGLIVAPLIAFLKKNAFTWNQQPSEAFQQLKKVVSQPLVLKLPDFT